MPNELGVLPPKALWINELVGGRLGEMIAQYRADGLSWDAIARELYVATDHKATVTGPAIKVWAQRLGIEEAA